jgi:hypothetical protein
MLISGIMFKSEHSYVGLWLEHGTVGKYCSAIIRRENNIAFEDTDKHLRTFQISQKMKPNHHFLSVPSNLSDIGADNVCLLKCVDINPIDQVMPQHQAQHSEPVNTPLTQFQPQANLQFQSPIVQNPVQSRVTPQFSLPSNLQSTLQGPDNSNVNMLKHFNRYVFLPSNNGRSIFSSCSSHSPTYLCSCLNLFHW